MKLEEAVPILRRACGRPFREVFAGHPEDLRTNKGHVGGLLEALIGLESSRRLLDFEDGELKTNKAQRDGQPLETLAVTTLLGTIDTLLTAPPLAFAESNVYRKISNFVYLPVVKDSEDSGDWFFVDVIHVRIVRGSASFSRLEEDYMEIAAIMRQHVLSGDSLHTANGPNDYLQVRTKDSKPYSPLWSEKFGREVSDKNRAFYLMKPFLRDAVAGRL